MNLSTWNFILSIHWSFSFLSNILSVIHVACYYGICIYKYIIISFACLNWSNIFFLLSIHSSSFFRLSLQSTSPDRSDFISNLGAIIFATTQLWTNQNRTYSKRILPLRQLNALFLKKIPSGCLEKIEFTFKCVECIVIIIIIVSSNKQHQLDSILYLEL